MTAKATVGLVPAEVSVRDGTLSVARADVGPGAGQSFPRLLYWRSLIHILPLVSSCRSSEVASLAVGKNGLAGKLVPNVLFDPALTSIFKGLRTRTKDVARRLLKGLKSFAPKSIVKRVVKAKRIQVSADLDEWVAPISFVGDVAFDYQPVAAVEHVVCRPASASISVESFLAQSTPSSNVSVAHTHSSNVAVIDSPIAVSWDHPDFVPFYHERLFWHNSPPEIQAFRVYLPTIFEGRVLLSFTEEEPWADESSEYESELGSSVDLWSDNDTSTLASSYERFYSCQFTANEEAVAMRPCHFDWADEECTDFEPAIVSSAHLSSSVVYPSRECFSSPSLTAEEEAAAMRPCQFDWADE